LIFRAFSLHKQNLKATTNLKAEFEQAKFTKKLKKIEK
jgi:hypothetical protein